MPEPTVGHPRPLWLDVAGVYLLVVGCVMALGVTAEHLWETPVTGNALEIDKIWVAGLAVVCVLAAIITNPCSRVTASTVARRRTRSSRASAMLSQTTVPTSI